MTPDKYFVETLKGIDRGLDVIWSPAMQIWCIFYTNPQGRTFKVLEVREEDGSYRPLDNRTIQLLRSWDTSKDARNAEQIARDQYNAYLASELNKRKKEREESLYRAKQLRSWWKKTFEILYDNKCYTEKPLKPALQQAVNNKMLRQDSTDLLGKLGMPHLPGNALSINP